MKINFNKTTFNRKHNKRIKFIPNKEYSKKIKKHKKNKIITIHTINCKLRLNIV